MKTIITLGEFNDLKEDIFFIFKHSSTCSRSATAHQRVNQYLTTESNEPIFKVIVQDSRELSNYISEKYDVKHESPQILLIKKGKCTGHLNHLKISEESMRDLL